MPRHSPYQRRNQRTRPICFFLDNKVIARFTMDQKLCGRDRFQVSLRRCYLDPRLTVELIATQVVRPLLETIVGEYRRTLLLHQSVSIVVKGDNWCLVQLHDTFKQQFQKIRDTGVLSEGLATSSFWTHIGLTTQTPELLRLPVPVFQ